MIIDDTNFSSNEPRSRWVGPVAEAIRMDAEIGSYQEDGDAEHDTPFFLSACARARACD